EKESGKLPIIGMLAVEGKRRKASWMKNGCNAFDNKRPKSNPLSFWEDQDILKYLKITGIPHSRIFGVFVEYATAL
ncbi:MAG: class V aminotransferase, partial [Eubacterium sp.]